MKYHNSSVNDGTTFIRMNAATGYAVAHSFLFADPIFNTFACVALFGGNEDVMNRLRLIDLIVKRSSGNYAIDNEIIISVDGSDCCFPLLKNNRPIAISQYKIH